MQKIKVGIIGATGYTGAELVRLLLPHDNVSIIAMCSRANIGKDVTNEFSNLIGSGINLNFIAPDDKYLFNCDVIFFATPHGVAMNNVNKFLAKGIKVIDLGADFRIKNDKLWSTWYKIKHTNLSSLQQAVYGLPEIYQEVIRDANLIANPGCYPTAVILSLLPLLKAKIINNKTIIADCKSGVSGAGRGKNIANLLCEASENLKPYGVNHHRHQPEIEQELTKLANEKIEIIFVPHLIPMIRGMLVTVYVDLIDNIDISVLFNNFYKDNNFIHILPDNIYPQTKAVRTTNNCQIAIKKIGTKLIITTVIDNLVKGAVGQAVQNMNIMFNLAADTGLKLVAINP